MLIGTHQQALTNIPKRSEHITNKPLRQVSVAKYLSMYRDSDLKWDEHIGKLTP